MEFGILFNEEVEWFCKFVVILEKYGVCLSFKNEIGCFFEDFDIIKVLCDNVFGFGLMFDFSYFLCGCYLLCDYIKLMFYVFYV